MNRDEFLKKIPGLIRHINHGVQYREIKTSKERIMVCYRGNDNFASFATYGKSFEEIVPKLNKILEENKRFLHEPPFVIPH